MHINMAIYIIINFRSTNIYVLFDVHKTRKEVRSFKLGLVFLITELLSSLCFINFLTQYYGFKFEQKL